MSLRSFVLGIKLGARSREREYERSLREMHEETFEDIASQFEEEEYGTPGKTPTSTGFLPSEERARKQEESLIRQFFFDPEHEEEEESVGEAKDWAQKEREEKEEEEEELYESGLSEQKQVVSNIVYNFKGMLRMSALNRIINRQF